MAGEDDRTDDPLGVEDDHDKRGDELPREGPPVAQMATTYGSSFVESDDQADAVAAEPSGPTGPPAGDGGNPGGAADSGPVEPMPQKTLDPGGADRRD